MANEKARAKAKELLNGCPLMVDRQKAGWDRFENEIITISAAAPITTAEGTYYCITVEEDKDVYLNTGKSLTEVIDAVGVNDIVGLQFKVGKELKTKAGKSFRPFTAL